MAVERKDQAKSGKDLNQAETLIEALAQKRPLELAEAWQTAWKEGDRWREKLERGRERLQQSARETLDGVLERAKQSRKRRQT